MTVSKIFQFIRETDRGLLNIRKSMMTTVGPFRTYRIVAVKRYSGHGILLRSQNNGLAASVFSITKATRVAAVEHSNSGKKKFRFDSIRQSDNFAVCTLIFR